MYLGKLQLYAIVEYSTICMSKKKLTQEESDVVNINKLGHSKRVNEGKGGRRRQWSGRRQRIGYAKRPVSIGVKKYTNEGGGSVRETAERILKTVGRITWNSDLTDPRVLYDTISYKPEF